MADITKHLERAKKYLEKNKLQDAVAEYEAVLAEMPNSPDVLQSLGDLHTRLGQADRAAKYYGQLFDRFAESRDTTKAVVLFTRFLKPVAQPPDRMARYAMLLQKQNKKDEAIEQYAAAAELFLQQRNETEALACWEKIAQLDPDNPVRHMKIGEVGERFAALFHDLAALLHGLAALLQGLGRAVAPFPRFLTKVLPCFFPRRWCVQERQSGSAYRANDERQQHAPGSRSIVS